MVQIVQEKLVSHPSFKARKNTYHTSVFFSQVFFFYNLSTFSFQPRNQNFTPYLEDPGITYESPHVAIPPRVPLESLLREDKKSLRVKRTVKSAQLSFEDRPLVGGKGSKCIGKKKHIVYTPVGCFTTSKTLYRVLGGLFVNDTIVISIIFTTLELNTSQKSNELIPKMAILQKESPFPKPIILDVL